ncbi:MAG: YgiQ family radical SAM protein [Clostridia bacterium]|nr:YgiQ family radical SAM protein [Clostridia bacterium]
MKSDGFLPVNLREATELGIGQPDFVYVTGDAYVDHPSFGPAIISRVLVDRGFSVVMLPQPDFRSAEPFREYGKPRLGFLVSGGNIDSMVAHYTVALRKRTYDYYSPGGKTGLRPDRATIVYCNRIREAYGDVPIIIGGLEASLRRFAHYDYWENRIRRSILIDSRADILSYGMGEKSVPAIAELLKKGVPVKKIRDVRGTCYVCGKDDRVGFEIAGNFDFNEIKSDKMKYAEAYRVQYLNQDSVTGKAVTERYDTKMLVQNPPMPPLEREELDRVYSLPYMRTYHPSYEAEGGVPGIEEVRFSIAHNRGCFGGCNFCAITFHQGRSVRSRSIESCVREAEIIASSPDFKGYIHDVGGPTADFRHPSCEKQLTRGVCLDRHCLAPEPCKALRIDHWEYTELLDRISSVRGVKKVFVRSGIRYDYVLADRDRTFFRKLVSDHVSGQLKVAPEHVCDGVLDTMGKPRFDKYEKFKKLFFEYSAEAGKEQYIVPYLMSSHPGSRLSDAIELALYLKRNGMHPIQVQDFYPTPGTVSTVMYYTGIDPLTGKAVYCANDREEKRMQRALLQFGDPKNADLIRKALRICHREDLIGYGKDCLVPPESSRTGDKGKTGKKNIKANKNKGKGTPPEKKKRTK